MVSRNLAENYKSRQNKANPNISRIGSAGFIFLKIRLGSLVYPRPCRLRVAAVYHDAAP